MVNRYNIKQLNKGKLSAVFVGGELFFIHQVTGKWANNHFSQFMRVRTEKTAIFCVLST